MRGRSVFTAGLPFFHVNRTDPVKLSFATLCVHGYGGVDPQTGAVSTPIYQSSTFAFHTAEEGAAIQGKR